MVEAIWGLLERLWPLWLLLMVLVGWRLWHLRVLGEGDPASTLAERRRWKRALLGFGALFLLSFLAAIFGGRPHEGDYQPAEMDASGNLQPATLRARDGRAPDMQK